MQPELIGGRYRVVRAVGRGGMGTVWLCRDETLEREVAVKQVGLLPGESTTDTVRALREARATAALNHRRVVAVYDVVQEDGAVWLVMEYVPSRTLAQIVADHGPLEPGRLAALGAQVADGLLAAHGAGLTHRDVKPGNVLVGEGGAAKIGDFGLSRTSDDTTLTSTGMISGTPSYLAPEVARGATPSPASDAWAFGATLYSAVEGRPPFSGDNPLAVLHQIAQEEPPRPQRAGTLEAVIAGLMARDPADRWSLTRAHDELARLAATPGEPTGDLTPPTAVATPTVADSPEPTRSWPADPTPTPTPLTAAAARRRRRPGPVVVGLLALLLAGAGVIAAVQLGNDADPGGAGNQAGPPRTTDEPSARPKGSRSPSPAPDDQQPSSSPADNQGGPASADEKVAMVDGYFDTVPDDLDAGWSMLSPAYRAETGRGSYDGFWAEIADVDASGLSAGPGTDVLATVTYEYDDGRTVEERQVLHLVEGAGGALLIDGYDQA